jgi:pyruvate/2-oxoglutarate dehydrogenase complex dihydrolipoamide acyltransferase (E2) component
MGESKAPEATEKAAELAKENSIDLGSVKGTGSEGRITVDDVKAAIEKKQASTPEATEKAAGGDDEEPSAAAKKIAAKMPKQAHLDGCPMPASRVEIYDQRVPPKVNSDGQVERPARIATMAHCVECGATIEIDG